MDGKGEHQSHLLSRVTFEIARNTPTNISSPTDESSRNCFPFQLSSLLLFKERLARLDDAAPPPPSLLGAALELRSHDCRD